MNVIVKETLLKEAGSKGTDAFLTLIHDSILEAIGGEVNAETLPLLDGEQTTLLSYFILREEVMDGGFIQLIHNGYGPFIFLNPFAKAMRLWGAHDFSKLIYKGRKLFEQYADVLQADCIDEEKADLLAEIAQKTYLTVELGLQTVHDETALKMNRCHTYEDFFRLHTGASSSFLAPSPVTLR